MKKKSPINKPGVKLDNIVTQVIKISIHGTEHKLTKEEAIQIRDMLNKAFPVDSVSRRDLMEEIKNIRDRARDRSDDRPWFPIIPPMPTQWPYDPNKITC